LRVLAPIVLFALLLIACGESEKVDKRKKVARVHNTYLYQSDLKGVVTPGSSAEDSIAQVQNYIDDWIRQQAILYQAEKSMSSDLKKIERQMEDYRNSLIIYAFEKELTKQKLDTVVTKEEIEAYYLDNKQDFLLKDHLVKVLYLKLLKTSPDIEKMEQWYKLEGENDLTEVQDYAREYAENFYYDENNWLYFDDIIKEVPLKLDDKLTFIRKRKKIKLEDDSYIYFLNVLDYRLEDGISPMNLEHENIKGRIMNLRIRAFIENTRQDLLNKAYENKSIEIY
jgi:hypothetical protein